MPETQTVLSDKILPFSLKVKYNEPKFKHFFLSSPMCLLKMISSPYCAVSEPNVYKHYKRLTQWNANRCYSLRTTYL